MDKNLFELSNSSFHKNVILTNNYFTANSKYIKPIIFPEIKLYTSGDLYFRNLWEKIDEAKDYVWILTYTFDATFAAKTTMVKLLEAQKRGVNCVLLIDDLNNWVDKGLKNEFIEAGGIFHSLNPVKYFWKIFTKEFFRRHHEKVSVIDNTSIIGSSNITDDYGSIKYGSFEFFDLNMFATNTALKESRNLFYELAEFYKLNLSTIKTNEQIRDELNTKFVDSDFIQNKEKIKMIKTHPTKSDELQKYIINMINNSEKEVVIIQPYYYPIKKIERAIGDALSRGVKVELITSAKRDQPCYAPLKNLRMTQKLIDKGLKVYEMNDKFLHMKAYYVDDKIITLGSFNNDKWSWKINNEANIYLENEYEAQKFKKEIVDVVKKQCKLVNQNSQIGWMRYSKITFWEFFLYCSEWVMDQKKYAKLEQKMNQFESIKRTPLEIFLNPSIDFSYDFDYNVI